MSLEGVDYIAGHDGACYRAIRHTGRIFIGSMFYVHWMPFLLRSLHGGVEWAPHSTRLLLVLHTQEGWKAEPTMLMI